MQIFQPITECSATDTTILWHVFRPDLEPPGPYDNWIEHHSELMSSEFESSDFYLVTQATRLLSGAMTDSELGALQRFLLRCTPCGSLTGRQLPIPLTPEITDARYQPRGRYDIDLTAHPEYDLPWTVKGRLS